MSQSFRLGIFMLATLAILAACVLYIGRQGSTFGSYYRVKCEFASIAGLQEGATVRVGGVREGTVDSIRLPAKPDGKVLVTLSLAKATQSILRADSIAAIQSEGLLGDKYVEVSFGSVDAARLKGGETLDSEPPFDMSDLFAKANGILDTSQGALDNILGATDNINLITGKINTGHGTMGKLLNDSTLYKQASASVTSLHDDADAMKHNFLLRGFFKDRGYSNPTEIKQHALGQLPREQPVKSFTLDPKNLFDKPDSAKLKNQKSLAEVGEYLQSQKFGLAVITSATSSRGDSDIQLALSEARAYVVRKYLVDTYSLDDTRLMTLGLGKSASASPDGKVEIVVYASGQVAAGKAPVAGK